MNKMSTLFFLITLSAATLAQNRIAELKAQLEDNPNDVHTLVQLGIACHFKGLEGDEDAVEKGVEYLGRAVELDNEHALALAYLGSITSLKGRDALLPWNKMKHVERGVDKLDKAVDLAPENLEVRMVRAMNSLNLPDFFHRLQYSLKDFAFISAHPEFQHWPADQKANVYHHFGRALLKDEKPGKAREQFELATQTAPESAWAAQAREKLRDINSAN